MQGSRKEYIKSRKPWVPEGPGKASNGWPKGLWQGLMAGVEPEGPEDPHKGLREARGPRKEARGAGRGARATSKARGMP